MNQKEERSNPVYSALFCGLKPGGDADSKPAARPLIILSLALLDERLDRFLRGLREARARPLSDFPPRTKRANSPLSDFSRIATFQRSCARESLLVSYEATPEKTKVSKNRHRYFLCCEDYLQTIKFNVMKTTRDGGSWRRTKLRCPTELPERKFLYSLKTFIFDMWASELQQKTYTKALLFS